MTAYALPAGCETTSEPVRESLRIAGARPCEKVPEGREERIATYRYLCRRGARKFLRPGLERADLEQVATIGLIKAADRFDPAKATPFEAFAWLTVVGELMHHVRDHEHAIRIPRRVRALERSHGTALERLTVAFGREPRDAEVASELGVDVRELGDLRLAREASAPIRLDDPRRGYVEVEDDAGSGASFDDRFAIASAVAALPENERRVVVGVYALGLTQGELARRLGVAPKRISRLHRAALMRLRAACGVRPC